MLDADIETTRYDALTLALSGYPPCASTVLRRAPSLKNVRLRQFGVFRAAVTAAAGDLWW